MKYPTKLKIRLHDAPVLRVKAGEVTEFDADLAAFCDRMLETLNSKNALGLAAPQVAVSRRIFVTRHKPCIWINPDIRVWSGSSYIEEGCLSFPDVYHKIMRSRKITVWYQDVDGNEQTKTLDAKKGSLSIVVQHELDHLNGILFIERLGDKEPVHGK